MFNSFTCVFSHLAELVNQLHGFISDYNFEIRFFD